MVAVLNKITLREVSKLSEAEILLRDLPQDNAAGHVAQIIEKINSGLARVYNINNHGEKIGVCVAEIYGKDFVILAMYVSKVIDAFKTVYPLIEKLAKESRCESLVFWTVRAGLITNAINDGWRISHVEMRKTL